MIARWYPRTKIYIQLLVRRRYPTSQPRGRHVTNFGFYTNWHEYIPLWTAGNIRTLCTQITARAFDATWRLDDKERVFRLGISLDILFVFVFLKKVKFYFNFLLSRGFESVFYFNLWILKLFSLEPISQKTIRDGEFWNPSFYHSHNFTFGSTLLTRHSKIPFEFLKLWLVIHLLSGKNKSVKYV